MRQYRATRKPPENVPLTVWRVHQALKAHGQLRRQPAHPGGVHQLLTSAEAGWANLLPAWQVDWASGQVNWSPLRAYWLLPQVVSWKRLWLEVRQRVSRLE